MPKALVPLLDVYNNFSSSFVLPPTALPLPSNQPLSLEHLTSTFLPFSQLQRAKRGAAMEAGVRRAAVLLMHASGFSPLAAGGSTVQRECLVDQQLLAAGVGDDAVGSIRRYGRSAGNCAILGLPSATGAHALYENLVPALAAVHKCFIDELRHWDEATRYRVQLTGGALRQMKQASREECFGALLELARTDLAPAAAGVRFRGVLRDTVAGVEEYIGDACVEDLYGTGCSAEYIVMAWYGSYTANHNGHARCPLGTATTLAGFAVEATRKRFADCLVDLQLADFSLMGGGLHGLRAQKLPFVLAACPRLGTTWGDCWVASALPADGEAYAWGEAAAVTGVDLVQHAAPEQPLLEQRMVAARAALVELVRAVRWGAARTAGAAAAAAGPLAGAAAAAAGPLAGAAAAAGPLAGDTAAADGPLAGETPDGPLAVTAADHVRATWGSTASALARSAAATVDAAASGMGDGARTRAGRATSTSGAGGGVGKRTGSGTAASSAGGVGRKRDSGGAPEGDAGGGGRKKRVSGGAPHSSAGSGGRGKRAGSPARHEEGGGGGGGGGGAADGEATGKRRK